MSWPRRRRPRFGSIIGTETRAGLWSLGLLAILAFAANSLFARAALENGTTGPGAFAAIRLAAGATILLPILRGVTLRDHAGGGLALAAYAMLFAFAYVELGAASGALILFAAVQASVVTGGLIRGGRIGLAGLIGIGIAMGGVVALLLPGAGRVDGVAAMLMIGAGLAWGAYTLIGYSGGRGAARSTAASFLIAAILAAPLLLLRGPVSGQGALLAVLSGALTSGLGYVAWYAVAPRLSLGGVAAVQLATPIAAALLAWPLLGEMPSMRLVVAGTLVLGGIAMAMRDRTT